MKKKENIQPSSEPRAYAEKVPVFCSFDKLENPHDLIGNPRNPNQHPEEQIKILAHIIQKQGWRSPITVSKRSGFVVRGHGRLAAALEFGTKLVPVDYQDYNSEAEEWADLLADNRIAELSVMNSTKLNELLVDLASSSEIDTTLTGFSEGQIEEILSSMNESENEKDISEKAALSLREKFIVSPFSIIDARTHEWQQRKKIWRNLGIKSEIGREKTLTFEQSSQPLSTYKTKENYEKKIGKKITWKEFAEFFPEEMELGGTSIFDPVLCEIIYRWFCPHKGSIIDPFAGGSVRGIVAALTNRRYTGVDISKCQIKANRENWGEISEKIEVILQDEKIQAPKWINGDSANISTIAKGEYDLFFTCPPYADLEVYSDHPADISNKKYPDFLKLYREIIAQSVAMLKTNRFACVVVGEVRGKDGNYYNFVGDTIKAFTDAGLKYYNEAILITPFGSLPVRAGKSFENSRKIGKTHQNILMFVNGNPKKAAAENGSFEICVGKDFGNSRKIGKTHQNILMFVNGNPKKAADDIGVIEAGESLAFDDYNSFLLEKEIEIE